MVKGQAEQTSGEFVSGDYFPGLGVPLAAGRAIAPEGPARRRLPS